MSLENTAIDAKTKLKQAIKAGKSECATLLWFRLKIIIRKQFSLLKIAE